MRVGRRREGGRERRGTETDEQLCQVDFAPLGKGNLSVGEETVGDKGKKKKVSGVGCQRRRVGSTEVAEGACYHTRGASTPPSLHLTSLCSPPRAKNANCQCEY